MRPEQRVARTPNAPLRVPVSVAARPVYGTHASNDYRHTRPLLDALEEGFVSIGVDVWLVNGALYLGRDWPDMGRRLDAEYLEPLAELVARTGAVYPGWTGSLALLLDVRTHPVATWQAVEAALEGYGLLTTCVHDGELRPGPVSVVLTGNTSREQMASARHRRCLLDGTVDQLGQVPSPSLMPLVSERWAAHSSWNGEGDLPASVRERLEDLVAQVHDAGARLRFYGTWDWPGEQRDRLWAVLADLGVDLISTSDLVGLSEYLLARVR